MLLNVSLEKAHAGTLEDGYYIANDAISVQIVDELKEFWLSHYRKSIISDRVIWHPMLGQANSTCYSADKLQNLFRSYDFLWNEPTNALTRELALETHYLRNKLVGREPDLGLRYAPGLLGIYVSVSYYPANSGWLAPHRDRVNDPNISLYHVIVPLTYRAIDYCGGGLYLVDRKGQRIDVDAHLRPGSLLIYDGSLLHGVDKIVPIAGKSLGRLQTFNIMTNFHAPWDSRYIVDHLRVSQLFRYYGGKVKERARSYLLRPGSLPAA